MADSIGDLLTFPAPSLAVLGAAAVARRRPTIVERFEQELARAAAPAPPLLGLRALDAPLQIDDGLLAGLERARARLAAALAAAANDPALRCGPNVLLEAMSRDGVGLMHRAYDRHLQRFVAVRTLEDFGPAPPDAHRALLRARNLRHPNLLTLLGHGLEPDGRLWLSYELTPGRTLEPRVDEPARRAPRDAARVVRDAARGVAHARALELGHGGLTPASILVDGGGRGRVLDLGLAVLEAGSATGARRHAERLRRAGCRPPELVTGAIADPGGDVFALGAILHRLVTGQPPCDGADEPSSDAALDAVCARCLHEDPARRYAHAGDLARDLDRWLHGEAPHAVADLGGSVGLVLRRALDAVAGLFTP